MSLRLTLVLFYLLGYQLVLAENNIEIKDGDRIAFIGNTFVERAQRFGHIESAILAASPAKNLVFRNLGWSGDSVFNDSRSYFGPPKEGRERLGKAVAEMKPSIAFVCYGTGTAMSIDQAWTEEKSPIAQSNQGSGISADLDVFIRGYQALLENVETSAGNSLRTIVLVTPPPLENLGAPLPDQIANNQNLAEFSKAIIALAKKNNYQSIDLFNAIGYSKKTASLAMTNNGVHYHEGGYEMIARHWVKAIGLSNHNANYTKLRDQVVEKNRLFFHRWRPANETYLFLFRKHEQGNNAKEIPMFDPLIKEREAKIEKLRIQIQNAAKPA